MWVTWVLFFFCNMHLSLNLGRYGEVCGVSYSSYPYSEQIMTYTKSVGVYSCACMSEKEREIAETLWECPWGIEGHTLVGRWKMIPSPRHFYLSNTICVLSYMCPSAHIHTHVQIQPHAQIHLSGEWQGQEVWGLIERPHGATITLNVQVFIKV